MTPDAIVGGYVVVFLATLCVLGLYYQQRQKRFGPTPSKDRIFRCDKCGFVYTDDADVDRSRCPHCSTLNEAIRF